MEAGKDGQSIVLFHLRWCCAGFLVPVMWVSTGVLNAYGRSLLSLSAHEIALHVLGVWFTRKVVGRQFEQRPPKLRRDWEREFAEGTW